MKRTMGGAALVAAMMALAPMHADAQMGPRGQRGMMPRAGGQPGMMRRGMAGGPGGQ